MVNLPSSLTSLQFGRSFWQSVDQLPYSITFLDLGNHFNKGLCRLPAALTDLFAISLDLSHVIHSPPPHLTSLSIHVYEKRCVDLPRSLTKLPIASELATINFDHLPSSLTILDLDRCSYYNDPLDHLQSPVSASPRGIFISLLIIYHLLSQSYILEGENLIKLLTTFLSLLLS